MKQGFINNNLLKGLLVNFIVIKEIVIIILEGNGGRRKFIKNDAGNQISCRTLETNPPFNILFHFIVYDKKKTLYLVDNLFTDVLMIFRWPINLVWKCTKLQNRGKHLRNLKGYLPNDFSIIEVPDSFHPLRSLLHINRGHVTCASDKKTFNISLWKQVERKYEEYHPGFPYQATAVFGNKFNQALITILFGKKHVGNYN